MPKSSKGTVQVPLHPKFKAVQKTPLARTTKGLSGITPVGVTGHQNHTKHGMAGGHVPAMRPGGRNKGHKVPISFNFPQMRSATAPISMGAYDGGNVGINPPFKKGHVSGKKAKVRQKGY
jgi:hypothetical protein